MAPTATPLPPSPTVVPATATAVQPTPTALPPTATAAAPTATASKSATTTATPATAPTRAATGVPALVATATAPPQPATPPATATSAPQPAGPGCPPWLPPIQPGKALLIIENHFLASSFVILHAYPAEQFEIQSKANESAEPGRLVLQLAPGEHRFEVRSAALAGGTFRASFMFHAESGKAYLEPILLFGSSIQHIDPFPYAAPEGCQLG